MVTITTIYNKGFDNGCEITGGDVEITITRDLIEDFKQIFRSEN
jgi:hypothetical protein